MIADIDELVGTDPAVLGHPDLIVELYRQSARLAAVTARATAAFDTSGDWQADGARNAAAWLSRRCRLPKSTARAQVAAGRCLRNLPVAEQAWLAGDINGAHVRVLAAARTPTTADRLAADEARLVDYAKTLPFHQVQTVVAYWSQHADPDGSDTGATDQRNAREVQLSRSFDGLWLGDMVFDPLSGAAVAGELERLYQPLFEDDWASAKARLGRDPKSDELGRTPAQRRADALVEMAARSKAAPPDARQPQPLFTVLVDYPTLTGRICQLADGTVIAPGALIPWLDRALIERIVFGGPSRVIDVGAARRLFTGATRRAVEVRDRECFHPYCDTPGPQCQVDHITPYHAGGPTTQDNGRLACGFHNRDRHKPPTPKPDP